MYIEGYNLKGAKCFYPSSYVVYICETFEIFIPPMTFLVFDSLYSGNKMLKYKSLKTKMTVICMKILNVAQIFTT